eukprot:2348861-Rhodomonas_salina.1
MELTAMSSIVIRIIIIGSNKVNHIDAVIIIISSSITTTTSVRAQASSASSSSSSAASASRNLGASEELLRLKGLEQRARLR